MRIKYCANCGKMFFTFKSTIKKGRKFCSLKCYWQSREGKPTWNKNIKGAGYKWKGIVIKNNCKCKVCGKNFHTKPFAIKRGRGKYCSKSCYGLDMSIWMKGENNPQFDKHWGQGKGNPNWRGGIAKLPYPFIFTKELKDKIRNRDNYKCKLCGRPEVEYFRKFPIHHIDYNKQNCKEDNLCLLCNICNSKVNFNREYWEQYFSKVVMPKCLVF